jgi:hypothetical protein
MNPNTYTTPPHFVQTRFTGSPYICYAIDADCGEILAWESDKEAHPSSLIITLDGGFGPVIIGRHRILSKRRVDAEEAKIIGDHVFARRWLMMEGYSAYVNIRNPGYPVARPLWPILQLTFNQLTLQDEILCLACSRVDPLSDLDEHAGECLARYKVRSG